MFGGRSRSTSTSSTRTDVQNINLQDIEGLAVVARGNVDISQTDQGAIRAARDIALEGLDVGRTGFTEVLDLATATLRSGQAQTQAGLGLAGSIAARESQNVGARFETITRNVIIGAGVVLVVVVFAQSRNK